MASAHSLSLTTRSRRAASVRQQRTARGGRLGSVRRAGQDNHFGVALAATHDGVAGQVATRQNGQRSVRQAFGHELRLNLRLQRVAGFEAPTARRG